MKTFIEAARNVGAEVEIVQDVQGLVTYVTKHAGESILFSPCPSLERLGVSELLSAAGLDVIDTEARTRGASAASGLTGANFGIAPTGTVVLESTDELVRIASTLPQKHFVLLDPRKILPTSHEAIPLLRSFHQQLPEAYLAYITGPSRTADIERVLTIGVHGPAELHILLLEGVSDDLMER